MLTRFLRSVTFAAVLLSAVSCIASSCQFESKWKTAPKYYLINDTGVTVNVYYIDESRGAIRREPTGSEAALNLSKIDSERSPDLQEEVDFDDDECIDVSILAFEVDFHDPERDGRLVDRIPAGTCWEPGSQRTFTLESK